jgi:isopentenyl phosphate kinase
VTPTDAGAEGQPPLVLVKLGGSVLTHKSSLGGIRHENVVRLARELTQAAQGVRLVIVHGGGSVGHPLARLYHIYGRVDRPEGRHGDRAWRSEGASVIQRNMLRLNAALVGALMDNGMPALSVPGGILAELEDGRLVRFHPGSIERYLENGLVPVTFGDVAPDQKRGLAIVSGDTLILALAEALRPDRVVFATDQDGVFESDPARDEQARLVESLDPDSARQLADRLAEAVRARKQREAEKGETGRPVTDATGGIIVKLEELAQIADLGVPASVVSGLRAGRLAAAVRGVGVKGTHLVPREGVQHAR